MSSLLLFGLGSGLSGRRWRLRLPVRILSVQLYKAAAAPLAHNFLALTSPDSNSPSGGENKWESNRQREQRRNQLLELAKITYELSPRKPAPRIASLHERTLLCGQRISCSVAAINDGQRFLSDFFIQPSFTRYGTEDLLLPHARASSRRGHDPDGSGGNGPFLDPLIDILPEPSRRPTRGRARSLRRRRQVEGGSGVGWCSTRGREAQLKLDTQPTAGGRTLVDADRIKAARIGDPRWRRSDRARLPTADQAIHASDGSSQGSTCQRAVSLNLFFSL
ncbi:hypothetical protein EVAR_26085_1 [Eumeta japonica]|uniref:Uncharacterized protein n=1 Tax=Eumeta variegata TaxID=151549 RepID=A0A4C1X177_EUMVA|nr:hypothetical protein EVAR_26085_1 [Eumeta japonica]